MTAWGALSDDEVSEPGAPAPWGGISDDDEGEGITAVHNPRAGVSDEEEPDDAMDVDAGSAEGGGEAAEGAGPADAFEEIDEFGHGLSEVMPTVAQLGVGSGSRAPSPSSTPPSSKRMEEPHEE